MKLTEQQKTELLNTVIEITVFFETEKKEITEVFKQQLPTFATSENLADFIESQVFDLNGGKFPDRKYYFGIDVFDSKGEYFCMSGIIKSRPCANYINDFLVRFMETRKILCLN